MSIAATVPAVTTTDTLHVVAPGDYHHKRGDRCARCHRAVIPCDVITTSQTSPTIVHVACLTQRQQAAITDPTPCWFHDSRTLAGCPLPTYHHNLCRAHHAQLCCSKRPK
jgi:hypothetical protein